MPKSTLLIMSATIAIIITTSVLTFALPYQVFAQSIIKDLSNTITKGERGLLEGDLQGHGVGALCHTCDVNVRFPTRFEDPPIIVAELGR